MTLRSVTLGSRVWSDRKLGWLAVVAGGALALGVQLLAPVRAPLYDGVVVQEPYRYLHPIGDHAGSPTDVTKVVTVDGPASPVFAAATSEQPVQAQVVGQEDALALPAGTASLTISIKPVEPPPTPPAGSIAGNVYRFSVTDQAGTPLAAKPCPACLAIVLRAPEGIGEASLMRFADGAWKEIESDNTIGLFHATITAFGDYAIVEAREAEAGPDTVLIVAGVALLLLLAGGAFLFFRVKPAPPPPPSRGAGRVPSKRRAPRTPPPGRPNR